MENSIPPSAGIYKIICIPTKKIYIGSAVNLHRRQIEHFSDLRQNKHGNPYMQHAWNKYGEQAFTFEVWELVLPMSLTAREQYWLNTLKPFGRKGFNIAFDATSPTLGRKRSSGTIEKLRQTNLGNKNALGHKHTLESLAKMRQVQGSPEAQERKRQANLARSFETQEKMRRSMIGKNLNKKHSPEALAKMKNREFSPEHRENLRQAKRGKKLVDGKYV